MGGQGSGGKLKKEVKFAPDRSVWERQPKETDPAWNAFLVYRDMSSRTIASAAKALGKRPTYKSTMDAWSSKYGWRHRCVEWDREQDRVGREAKLGTIQKEAQDMVKRHTQTASLLQRVATVELQRWLHKIGGNAASPDLTKMPQLNTKQLKSLLEYGISLERLNRGEPSEITEQRTEHSVADQRKMMRKLLTPESIDDVSRLLDLMDDDS